MSELETALKSVAADIETLLDGLLPPVEGPRGRVVEAMRYGCLGGGKRLRPFLVVAGADLFGIARSRSLRVGAAVEMVHGYSLIHDDLPAMDDSDIRRGRPSVHKAFDEATAILAGDGLLTRAFGVLSDPETHDDPAVRCELVAGLSRAAGEEGMVGGQMIDILAERHETALTLEDISDLQQRKTGALFDFAALSGPILASAEKPQRLALWGYAKNVGLAFQIADDLLDLEGDAGQLGKPIGQDAAAGKATFVSDLGAENAREWQRRLVEDACARLDVFQGNARLLHDLAHFVVERRS